MKFNSPVVPGALFLTLGLCRVGCPAQADLSAYWGVEGIQAVVEERDPARGVCLLFSLVTTALKMIWAQLLHAL